MTWVQVFGNEAVTAHVGDQRLPAAGTLPSAWLSRFRAGPPSCAPARPLPVEGVEQARLLAILRPDAEGGPGITRKLPGS